jgi:phosphoribosylaminoimidazolecarboxamide formyltransferase/IMP cyclohydrolase
VGGVGSPLSVRIAVAVSGAGSNLRALVAAARAGWLGGEVVLVVADRPCPALDWASGEGIPTVLVPGGDDVQLADLFAAQRIDLVVLAGYMRIVGPRVLAAYRERIVNTHPSLLPAFPGAHAVRDALATGVTVTGCTIHFVDETLDGGPIIVQEPVPVLPGDDEASLHGRIRAVEHRLLPRVVALLAAGAVVLEGRHVRIDLPRAAQVPWPRQALLSVSDKTGLVEFATGLAELGILLVASGGTARALREAGLPVTEVAELTGAREILDGRVKTLHPKIHAGILADRRRPGHREALAEAFIAPFDLVVVNLYPFEAAAERADLPLDDLVEEIDIGGPALLRAAAKNWANVAVVTSPARYRAVLEALRHEGGIPEGLRAALAAEAFRHTAAYDARIAEVLPERIAAAGVALPDEPGLPRASDPFPPRFVLALDKVETLRYGENPHQRAARYRRPGATPADGPFWDGGRLLGGKALSYTNVLDAAAAAGIARALRGPAAVVVKHTNPCGAAERDDLVAAWRAALAGDPVSAFGGVVAVTGVVGAELAEALSEIFLEVVVAPAFAPEALAVFSRRPNLRLLLDPGLGRGDGSGGGPRDPTGLLRTAGGAVLVGEPDVAPDDPAAWQVVTRRPPSEAERADLDLAWRLVRFVTSNAIVLVRDRMLVGVGVGQTSRVDAARQAVEKAIRLHGPDALRGAACASDAFFPFPDGVEVCLAAGVSAFVQPGGSVRDAEVVAAADRAGAAMCFTGRRHFRH